MPRPATTQHSRSGEVAFDIGSGGQSWRNRACGSGAGLSLQHRDWITGVGGKSARVAIVSRVHPHGRSATSGEREVHIGSRLDRLYADYVWWLCDRGADGVLDDWDSSYIFCNVMPNPLFAPLRTESVYAHLRSMTHRDNDFPNLMTPRWFRHTHATALLRAGSPVHTVRRRLGHAGVQTTMNTYGHVTEDAELASVANWREYVDGWEYPNAYLMMDFDPLEPTLRTRTDSDPDSAGVVARMRYQPTKVELNVAPTIPVDEEIVTIIRAQQKHAREIMAHFGNRDATLK